LTGDDITQIRKLPAQPLLVCVEHAAEQQLAARIDLIRRPLLQVSRRLSSHASPQLAA
jgi:hypothetical protein